MADNRPSQASPQLTLFSRWPRARGSLYLHRINQSAANHVLNGNLFQWRVDNYGAKKGFRWRYSGRKEPQQVWFQGLKKWKEEEEGKRWKVPKEEKPLERKWKFCFILKFLNLLMKWEFQPKIFIITVRRGKFWLVFLLLRLRLHWKSKGFAAFPEKHCFCFKLFLLLPPPLPPLSEFELWKLERLLISSRRFPGNQQATDRLSQNILSSSSWASELEQEQRSGIPPEDVDDDEELRDTWHNSVDNILVSNKTPDSRVFLLLLLHGLWI